MAGDQDAGQQRQDCQVFQPGRERLWCQQNNQGGFESRLKLDLIEFAFFLF